MWHSLSPAKARFEIQRFQQYGGHHWWSIGSCWCSLAHWNSQSWGFGFHLPRLIMIRCWHQRSDSLLASWECLNGNSLIPRNRWTCWKIGSWNNRKQLGHHMSLPHCYFLGITSCQCLEGIHVRADASEIPQPWGMNGKTWRKQMNSKQNSFLVFVSLCHLQWFTHVELPCCSSGCPRHFLSLVWPGGSVVLGDLHIVATDWSIKRYRLWSCLRLSGGHGTAWKAATFNTSLSRKQKRLYAAREDGEGEGFFTLQWHFLTLLLSQIWVLHGVACTMLKPLLCTSGPAPDI